MQCHVYEYVELLGWKIVFNAVGKLVLLLLAIFVFFWEVEFNKLLCKDNLFQGLDSVAPLCFFKPLVHPNLYNGDCIVSITYIAPKAKVIGRL